MFEEKVGGVMDIKGYIKSRWDEHSENYENIPAHGIKSEKDKKVVKEALKEMLENRKKVLDVGCGTGFVSLILAELGHEVVGIDLSEGMLSKAREKAEEKGHNILFKIDDAENLAFEDNTFDAVIERHVLWTLPNPEKAIKEWVRVLRQGGKLILIESENKEEKTANHHYSEEIARKLPFGNGIDLRKFKKIADKCNLTLKIRKLNCERINLMIVCEK
nr:class I SAM-dependent methyltransferase [Archaeoglobus sulfaticallidus]